MFSLVSWLVGGGELLICGGGGFFGAVHFFVFDLKIPQNLEAHRWQIVAQLKSNLAMQKNSSKGVWMYREQQKFSWICSDSLAFVHS